MKIGAYLLIISFLPLFICCHKPSDVKSIKVSDSLLDSIKVSDECYAVDSLDYMASYPKKIIFSKAPTTFALLLNDPVREHCLLYKFSVSNQSHKDLSIYYIPGEIHPGLPAIRAYEDVSVTIDGQNTSRNGLLIEPKTLWDGQKQRAPFVLFIKANTTITVTTKIIHRLPGLKKHFPILLSASEFELLGQADRARDFPILLFQGIFHALLLFQICFTFFQWIQARHWFFNTEGIEPIEYLYYIGYMIGMMFFFMGIYGYFLFPSVSSQMWAFGIVCAPFFAYWMYFRFARHFLGIQYAHNTKSVWMKIVERYLLVVSFVNLALLMAYFISPLFVNGFQIARRIQEFTSLVIAVIAVFFLLTLRRMTENKLTWFIIFGIGFILVTGLITTIASALFFLGYPIDWESTVPLQFGIILETLCFTLGLSYKFRQSITHFQGIQHDILNGTLTRISKRTLVLLERTKDQLHKDMVLEILNDAIGAQKYILGTYPVSPDPNDIFFNLIEANRSLLQQLEINYLFKPNEQAGNVRLLKAHALELQIIFDEALTNILKHAKCSKIVADIKMDDSVTLIFSLSDNGIGLPNNLIDTGGMGFSTMRNRAKHIGATLHISGEKNAGTCVSLHLNVLKFLS